MYFRLVILGSPTLVPIVCASAVQRNVLLKTASSLAVQGWVDLS